MAKNIYSDIEMFSSRVRWGAIIAGVLVAMVIQGLLGMFGLAIGLTAFNPARDQSLVGFGVGSGIWLILSTLISVFIGAWVTSWLANLTYRPDGIIHGIVTWSLFMVVTMFLIGSGVGNVIGGAFNLLSSVASGASQQITSEITSGQTTPQQLGERLTTGTVPGQAIPPERLTGAQAEQAANVAAGVAWWGFFATLLSLLAGAMGGWAGSRSVRRVA